MLIQNDHTLKIVVIISGVGICPNENCAPKMAADVWCCTDGNVHHIKVS